jgi:CubicO group peptidase (beta-lactamase class C family)
MSGRREWLRKSASWVVTAWTAGRAGGLSSSASGQTGPPAKAKQPGRYTVRKPAIVTGKGSNLSPTGSGSAVIRSDERLEQRLAPIRDKHQLPGLIGAVIRGDRLAAIAAVGVRKLGSSDRLRVTDQVHLGSCTKAMTATMLGTLVEDGLLSWSSTILAVFPDVAPRLHPDFQSVTLSQLLTHRAGLPHDATWWRLPGVTPTDQRRAALASLLVTAPLSRPGTTYAYSNVGYVLAGLMSEQVTGLAWEELMQQIVFEPLGMASAGFGSPGRQTSGKDEAPWGHREVHGRVEATRQDNPPSMGPAGTVHCSLPDWGKFASLHLLGAEGKARLLKPATFRALHTPPPGYEYAGGWIVLERSWADGRALNHSGSNTSWYSTIWIAPGRDFATLVSTNQGGSAAEAVCEEASRELITLALSTPGRKASRR